MDNAGRTLALPAPFLVVGDAGGGAATASASLPKGRYPRCRRTAIASVVGQVVGGCFLRWNTWGVVTPRNIPKEKQGGQAGDFAL